MKDQAKLIAAVASNASSLVWLVFIGSCISMQAQTPRTLTKKVIPESITNSDTWNLEGDKPHPLVDPYTLEFVALEAKVTTPNGNGWRHEYKISKNERTAMTNSYEHFSADIKVDLSNGGKVIVAQFHAKDLGTIMKLYVADTSESGIGDSHPSDGVFGVYVRIRNEAGNEEKKALGTIRSGEHFSFEVINDYGKVSVSAFDKSLTTVVKDDSAAYLKFGNYLQSQYPDGCKNCGKKGNSDSFAACYQDIGITEAKITMTNVSYERILGRADKATKTKHLDPS
ncbi:polysaccharide lyase family 7 protein [Rubritalea sp.]|uniref:polysaccharide lyase family 7 protein n=1 Tax=Rubritalea sp. TaxID=2109375 RepID=UPI003EF882AE